MRDHELQRVKHAGGTLRRAGGIRSRAGRMLRRAGGMRSRARALGALLTSAVLCACGVIAPSSLATGRHFQRGDVLVSSSGGIHRYGPDGTLRATISTAPAGPICFAPDGRRLVAPGVGLFDSSGELLPSDWASVVGGGECAVDGFGDVYLGGQAPHLIRKFDLAGTLLASYTVPGSSFDPGTTDLDLAPDQCTIDYHGDAGTGVNRFNVCSDAAVPALTSFGALLDQLRIRSSGQLIQVEDGQWFQFDPSGNLIPHAGFGLIANTLRVLSLDPDGASFWLANLQFPADSGPTVGRVDIATGQVLADWPAPTGGATGLAVYGPPLLGSADIGSHVDQDAAGTAEAFPAVVRHAGQLTRLDVYDDAGSGASRLLVGVYGDRGGRPGTLREEATIVNAVAGSWNEVQVPAIRVSAGQRLWMAILSPRGAGTVRLRDLSVRGGRSVAQTSAQTDLAALPASWAPGLAVRAGALAAYGDGAG